jgi:hypothetical protein
MSAAKKALAEEVTVGDFTISPFDRDTVWITVEATGEGGNFSTREVRKALRAKNPRKALREYFDENFP